MNGLLVAVSAEGLDDFLPVGVVDDGRSTEISLALVAHSAGQMAGAALTMLGFALGREAETLLGSLMGLLFRHDI